MTIAYYGKKTTSNPRYIAAVKAQQEKARAAAVPNEARERQRRVEISRRLEQERVRLEYERYQRLRFEYASDRPSIESIIAIVAERHSLTSYDIKGSSQIRKVAAARFEVIEELYTRRPDLSLPQIGRALGGRDHTTILNGLRKRGVTLRVVFRVDTEAIVKLAARGLTHAEIAAATGCSPVSVRHTLRYGRP